MQPSGLKIRVLCLTPELLFGGLENRILGLAKTIDRDQFDFQVVTLNAPNPKSEQAHGGFRDQFRRQGIQLRDLGVVVRDRPSNPWRPDHWLRKLIVVCRVLFRLRRLICDERIDILDVHGKDAIIIGAIASRFLRVGTIATLYHTWQGKVASLLGRLILSKYDCLVTDSLVRKCDLQSWVVGRPRVEVICNGIYPPQTDRAPSEIWADIGRAPPKADVIVGQVARLVPFKGQKTLLKAAKQVLQQCPGAFFLVIGFAPKFSTYDEELTAEVQRLGIADRVCIAGYRGRIADAWKLIDIHAHASHFDSLPNAILESMSLGKPAVVTDVGGIPELVTHEQTGLVAPAKSVSALADRLVQLIENPSLAQELGAAAKQRYEDRCRPERVATEIESLFRSLVERKRDRVSAGTRHARSLTHGANH